MLRAILLSAAAAVVSSIAFSLAMRRRRQEIDDYDNPCVRYLGPRFGIPAAALFFFAVGLTELNDPVNYRYSGNLAILAYTPLAISAFAFLASIFYWSYRITLEHTSITRTVWPLTPLRYSLSDLTSVEEKKMNNFVLHFSEGRQLKINGLLSGQSYFIERLMALTNGSSRSSTPPLRSGAAGG